MPDKLQLFGPCRIAACGKICREEFAAPAKLAG
jgi:hypothetical protein